MQKLIIITGEAWTGKSTCAELLYKRFNNSAWLDGDDVWRINPFSCDDSRLRNSDYNMAFVIDNYLKSNFDYIIFSSIVLCDNKILKRILSLISQKRFELLIITLYATKDTLKERARLRDNNNCPKFRLLEKSFEQKSIFIETTKKNPQQVVDKIENITNNPVDFGLYLTLNNDNYTWNIRE